MTGIGDFLLVSGSSDPNGSSASNCAVSASFADPAFWPGSTGITGRANREIAISDMWSGAQLLSRGGQFIRGSVGSAWLLATPSRHYQPMQSMLADWSNGEALDTSVLDGRFVLVLWTPATRKIRIVTDAFRTYPVAYAFDSIDQTRPSVVASDLRLLRSAWQRIDTKAARRSRIDPASIYHYLNFSFVPNESCVWTGLNKLAPGSELALAGQKLDVSRWWDAHYPTDLVQSDNTLTDALFDQINDTVRAYGRGHELRWGTFLSGGTDSSSISGILARQRAESGESEGVPSFSIGFDEPGFDELGFAQIASDAFGLDSHQYRITEPDAVDALVRLTGNYDEPFGNSSAIGGAICAQLAASSGIELLVAGDGGDEIFGGNERYLKDKIFQIYHRSPKVLRLCGSALAGSLRPIDSRWPNKVKNFVRRAGLPNPDRFYTDDSFASEYFDDLLSDQFRELVDIDDSLELQRHVYSQCNANDELHRLMYLDLKMAIAANDVVKVVGTTRQAGVGVAFPFLERSLVDYTGRLAVNCKLRGTDKRYLFKRAMKRILPPAILTKKKQGFGMPISVWLQRGGPFLDLVTDTLTSRAALARGLFRRKLVEQLLARHQRGVWDYSNELYILTMLELWHQHEDQIAAVGEPIAPEI